MAGFLAQNAGSIISGVSQLGSSLIQRGTTKKQGRLNRAHQMKLAEYSYAKDRENAEYTYGKNLEQWNRQNEYNSPEAQMQRFKEGGLNPNLIYGRGESGNSGSSPQLETTKYNTPSADYPIPPPVNFGIGEFQDFQLKKAQVDQTQERTKAITQEIINQKTQNLLFGTQLGLNTQKWRNTEALFPEQLTAQKTTNNKLTAELYNSLLTSIGQQKDNDFKQIRNNMANDSMFMHDPLWARQAQKYLQFGNPKTEWFTDGWKKDNNKKKWGPFQW